MNHSNARKISEDVLRIVEEHEYNEHLRETEKRRGRKQTEHVSVTMREELYRKLDSYARSKKLSISAAARVLIEKGLKEE